MRRGMALLVALLALSALLAAAMYLGRAFASRVQAQRQGAQREAALRRAEEALERAREALQSGALAAGKTFPSDGLSVACKGTAEGVRLEVWASPSAPVAAGKIPRLSRGVRVAWDLARDATGSGWRRADWRARDEITPP